MNKKLPTSSYIVMGLLSFGEPLSGYEIRKRAHELSHFYPAPAHSQIYKELRRLEDNELVTAEDVPQDGKPDKQIFELTAAGTAVFQKWVQNTALDPVVQKHPLLLKLYFGHMAQPAQLAEMLTNYIAQCNEALGQLAIVQEFMAEDPEQAYAALVVDWNYHHMEAERTIAHRLLEQIRP